MICSPDLRQEQSSFRLVGTIDWHPLLTQKLASELQARVDSAAGAPGLYEFMATATDAAGNMSQTMLREDGSPMTLQFPLKSGVELDAHIEPGGSRRTLVDYGKKASAHGRLLDAAGQPLANKPVIVDEDFGEGALIDHRVRTVMTDESGRWSSKLPAGPSRSVVAEYAGDQRYLDTSVAAGRMTVRTGAKLGLSRKHVPEGEATTFTGRIERLGARIPARGAPPDSVPGSHAVDAGRRCRIHSGRGQMGDSVSGMGSERTTSKT